MKNIFVNTLFILLTVGFVGIVVYLIHARPEYVWIANNKQLEQIANEVQEIDINCINDSFFNVKKRNPFSIVKVYGYIIPITEPERIERFCKLLINAECVKNDPPCEVLFMKTKSIFSNTIYCMGIDWDDEKFSGWGWESKELYDLVQQWRQEKIDQHNRSREKWEKEAKERENNPEYRLMTGPTEMGVQEDEQEDTSD